MLRARPLALAAADALRCFSPVLRQVSVIDVAVPVSKLFFGVVTAEQAGDGNMLRAARHTVTAGRTGNAVLLFQNLPHAFHILVFRAGKGLKIFHVAYVVGKLFIVAHAAEHHEYPLKGSRVAHGIAGVASRSHAVQHRLRFLRQLDKSPALDRFHHDDGLLVSAAHLVHGTALDAGVFVIRIIELDLHHFYLRMLVQNAFQQSRLVVK